MLSYETDAMDFRKKLTKNAFSRHEDMELKHHPGKEVWVWDLYCHLQPLKGNCKDKLKRFYYDAQLDKCANFTFSGCKGNKNNFESELECERRCKGANFLGVNEQQLPTVCFLQPDSGLCLVLLTHYYYDVDDRKCKSFMFGGCGGNLNRFETMAQCEEYCM
ncbi:boophilin-G2-like [Amyelois transitella]|uniref:boophilin-G2-like n=1 Tax=Amyelois transitella TaxID=680683 RepID=UPI0029904CF5|nr:boophilin-G2-like [Amyelois transitella]